MKKQFIQTAFLFLILPGISSAFGINGDSTIKNRPSIVLHAETDTAKLLNGKLKIISKEKDGDRSPSKIELTSRKDSTRKILETSWGSFDIGFNNYTDQTNYLNPGEPGSEDAGFLARMNPAATAGDFELRSGKSMHINIGIVKQQLSLYKNYINLVYGLTYDISNWSYSRSISWNKADVYTVGNQNYNGAFISRDSVSYHKNKLVTNFLQVPLLLRFETSPRHPRRNVYLSAGGYAGYLVRSHTKQIVEGSSKKVKQFDDFNLNKFQYGMQFELGYQGFSVFFKKDLTPMTTFGTKQYPYSFGVRLTGL